MIWVIRQETLRLDKFISSMMNGEKDFVGTDCTTAWNRIFLGKKEYRAIQRASEIPMATWSMAKVYKNTGYGYHESSKYRDDWRDLWVLKIAAGS